MIQYLAMFLDNLSITIKVVPASILLPYFQPPSKPQIITAEIIVF